MKNIKNIKKIGIFSAAVFLLTFLFAVTGKSDDAKILEIKEKLFIQQCFDIMFNTNEYVGKTVKLEGIYKTFQYPSGSSMKESHHVYRNSPGCCGDDGMVGFMVLLENCPEPEQNAWVEAVGKVEIADIGIAVLRLSSLKVMDVRGTEFVRY